MPPRPFTKLRPTASLARQVKQVLSPRPHGGHGGRAAHQMLESVREAEHAGRRIVIRTRYSVEVDGRPFTGHLAVDNDGMVTCHALPTYTFTSAVDLVKKLIDAFPEDFPARRGRRGGRRWQ